MTRPIYENAASRNAEREVAEFLQQRWNCTLRKLPMAYRVDCALFKGGRLAGWIEIKCRGRRYPEMFLSLHKYMSGRDLARASGVPFLIVYGFSDGGIFSLKTTEDTPVIDIGGRQDRGDWQDVEPMVLLKLADMTALK